MSDASGAGNFSPVRQLVCPVSGFSAADLGSNFTASTESSMGDDREPSNMGNMCKKNHESIKQMATYRDT